MADPNRRVKAHRQWRFYVGARGHNPPKSCPGPKIFNWFYSNFNLAVAASQMMRGQPSPSDIFPRTATAHIVKTMETGDAKGVERG